MDDKKLAYHRERTQMLLADGVDRAMYLTLEIEAILAEVDRLRAENAELRGSVKRAAGEDKELEAIEARLAATTPGSWGYSGEHLIVTFRLVDAYTGLRPPIAMVWNDKTDGEFIVHARQDVRNLLGRQKPLRAENDELRSIVEELAALDDIEVTAEYNYGEDLRCLFPGCTYALREQHSPNCPYMRALVYMRTHEPKEEVA